jgi:hypothetical protein
VVTLSPMVPWRAVHRQPLVVYVNPSAPTRKPGVPFEGLELSHPTHHWARVRHSCKAQAGRGTLCRWARPRRGFQRAVTPRLYCDIHDTSVIYPPGAARGQSRLHASEAQMALL